MTGDSETEQAGIGPGEWSERYEGGVTPWDLGRPHPELVRRMPELGPVGSVVVPGAGRGHDVGALAAAGWRVTAVDFAPAVEPDLVEAVGSRGRVVIGDVFAQRIPGVDMVFDHTFFCTIPPGDRRRFGRWASDLLAPGGTVVSVIFPHGRPLAAGGPPYGISTGDLGDALDDDFVLEVDEPAGETGRRSWNTRWAVFRRVS